MAQGEDLELELGTGLKPVSYDHGQKSQGITHAPTLPRFGHPESAKRENFCGGRDFQKAHPLQPAQVDQGITPGGFSSQKSPDRPISYPRS